MESYSSPIWANFRVSIKWGEGVLLPKTGKICLYLSKRKCQFLKVWLTQLFQKGYFDFNNECYSLLPNSSNKLLENSKIIVCNNFLLQFLLCDCKSLRVRFYFLYIFTIT